MAVLFVEGIEQFYVREQDDVEERATPWHNIMG